MRLTLISSLLVVVGLYGAQVISVGGQDDDDYSWYDYSGDAGGGEEDDEDDDLSGYYAEYDYHDKYGDNSLARGAAPHDSGPSFPPMAPPSGTVAPVSPSTLASHHTTLTRPVSRDSSRSSIPSRVRGFDRSLPPTSPEDAEAGVIPSSTLPRRPSLQGNPLQPILPPGFDGRGSSSGGVSPQSGVIWGSDQSRSGSPRSSQVAGHSGVGWSGVETSGHATSFNLGAGGVPPDAGDIEDNGDGTGTYYNGEGELGGGPFGASYDDRNLYEDVIEEEDIVLVNRRLEVPYGRVRYLDSENDLKIKVLPGHRCRVTVIEREPVIRRPGKLMPSNFSCDFGRNEVQYTHLGGQHPAEDTVKLLLRYDTRRDTFIIPITMSVRVLYDMQLEVVTKVVPLSVRQLLGVSNAIDGDNTVFAFDRTNHECKLTLLHRHSDLPRYGSVVSDAGSAPVGYMVPCQRFLELGVRYRHTVATSTKLDHIPAVVELYDGASMTLLKQEYFQYPVRIHPGRDNTAPAVSHESLLLLDVNQFVMTALTPSVVRADDGETPSERLVFNVTKPLAFGEGLLVSTDDQSLPVASFYQRDVGELKIVYKPPAEDSSAKRVFEVEFEVLDEEGLASPPFRVMIVVNPKMTMAPLTTKNAGLELFEGQSRRLSSARNLEIADEDNLEDVTLTVLDGLRHGRLLLMGAPAGVFSPADLDTGAVVYQHDGGETSADNLLLRVSDGEHEADFLFPITIFPEDDEPPVARVNTGLELRRNEEREITASILSATDVDSEDASISYVLQDPAPRLGRLVLRRPRLPPRPENWQFVDNRYERTATSWTQRDITDGCLHYVHQGGRATATVMDRVYFRLTDGSEPPNESGTVEMLVKVLPVDDTPPELDSNCSLTLMVQEHRLTALAAANLRYTDLDSSDGWVAYRIRPPHNVDANDPMSPGEIVLTDSPDTVVDSFTQSQLNYRKVSYRPPDHEIGIVPRIIQFEFGVEDKAGNSLRGQTFTIFLTPVDNQPPAVHNAGLRMVREHSQAVITSRHLNISDPDTNADDLAYRVVKAPSHGVLTYNALTLAPGDEFTPRDVVNRLIAYVNDGEGEADRDRFELAATDGVHTLPVNFFIDIEAIDDEPPRLAAAAAGSAGATVRVLEGREAAITSQVLRATDPDSEPIRLTFIVHEAPTRGTILLNGVPTSSFTQMSIDNGEVVYRHDGGDVGRSRSTDNFTLILSDMSDDYVYGGNRLERVLVDVTIEPVDNVAPRVFVDGPVSVGESSKSPISVEHIQVGDADTDEERLTCVITQQPRSGYVENASPAPGHERSREGTPITSFSAEDVLAGRLNYVQSVHTKVEPREDRFVFYCTDGVNRSPEATMGIRVTPVNDEAPEFSLKEFVVMEGMDLIIGPPVLVATDGDEPRDRLTFAVSRKPRHGRVMRQDPAGLLRAVDRFTADDLTASSKIVYSHDDSETTEDDFELLLTDGNPEHEVRKEVKVRILPEDDETPRLTLNTGLDVDVREAAVITNKDLMAEDLDSDDRNLTYVIREVPRFGYVELLEHETLAHLQNLTVGTNFTQGDVDDGVIQYRHTGIPGVRDALRFSLTDGRNANPNRVVYFNVRGRDNVYPDVVNKGVELPEGGRAALTTDILSTSDLNSADELLNFTITRAPSRGHLEISDAPGRPVATFTQLQLAGSKVFYVHDAEDEVKMDSFEFAVTDGHNSVSRTFRISISDVDNKRPVLFLGELRVREGGSRTVTPFELKVEDRDTPPGQLWFAVTRPPLHGRILYNGTRATRRFTQSDLEASLIAYRHDASETLSDDVRLVVADGTHADFYVYPDVDRPTRKPQRLRIRVEPVDDGVPGVRVNKGASHVSPLGEDGGGGPLGFVLSPRVLLVHDRDTGPEGVTYRVEAAPRHGSLVSDRHPNASVRVFTQEDVNERRIAYHLQEGANVTSDSFGFSVVDTGENKLESQVFKLEWSWVSLEKEVYEVNETSEMLIVTLRRRGYLGETSFVTMDLQNKTAHTDLDLHYSYARQVQFNPGQKSAQWRLRLVDDVLYEGRETLSLTLRQPVMTALEYPLHAVIAIHDEEDVSRVEFAEVEYKVEEDVGELPITLVRHGDVSQELAVKCATHSGSATGTVPTTVLSYSDYISHPNDPRSMVRFGKGERESVCHVVIIDDSLHEDEESFIVVLSHPMGGALGQKSNITITILPDLNDVPVIFFGESEYHVDESIGSVEITVWRSGTDLSRVATAQLASKALSSQQAQAGYDYVALGRQVDFVAGVTVQRVQLTILDDLGLPALEGTEILKLVLQVPFNASLGDPAVATIIINDSLSDLPRFEFHEAEYSGYEGDGDVTAWVKRSGDLSHAASVRCYTQQDTAVVTEDFDERPNTNSSFIYFQPGEIDRPCTVILVDDHLHEEEEVLHLVLGTPVSTSAGGALLGVRNTTTVLIKDKADKSTVRLEESRVSVKEPQGAGAQQIVRLGVLRTGDTSTTVAVRLHTKDGSATAGKDYFAISKEVVFLANDSRVDVEVTVLGDAEKEHRESFTVHLKPLRGSSSKINIITSKAIVYIEEMNTVADVTFPAPPAVVSLRDYDLASSAPTPIPGYPLICITACNMKYPDFSKTGPICIKQRINDTLSTFRWKVAAPSGFDGVTKYLRDVSSDTFFSRTHGITLDSVYFSAGSRVQCLARAHSIDEDAGLELASKPVTVGKEGGLCAPRYEGTFGADPFTAKLHYTGPKDPSHPSLVRVEVVIPHRDGMIPIISTRPLTNFELTLSRDSIRIGNHRCSNLLDFHEVRTQHGFLTNDTQRMDITGEMEPYQYSALLRSQPTLRFYRALDVESCLWRWVGYYTMSELITQCGGDITTDGQVLDAVLSYVSVAVPLYVSYIFHSPVATGGWQHTDLATHLRLSFVYDTAILWHQGIGAPVTTDFDGFLYPTAMKIKDDGCLIVKFRTEARFRGIYLEEHQASEHRSSVSSDDHPDLSFTLSLLRSQPTYSQPEQYWQFVSDFAVQDYSGSYVIHLLPCTVNEDVAYSFPLICNPQDLVMFDLKVRFQQVSDPVPEQFSLNTLFHLMRQRHLWLSEPTTDFDTESDVSFYPGDRIYGRIMIDPVQALGEGFHVTIEKCFICTGVDGYIPKYNPDTDEYGCVADSLNLLHNFKIIDKGAPDSVQLEYRNVGFDAHLAADDPDPDIIALIDQPAADGFSLDSSPLFQVSYGRQWFIHCIYTVRSEENAARGIGKRDTSMHVGHQHHALGKLPNTVPGQNTASPHTEYQQLSNDEKSSHTFIGYESSRFMQSTKDRKKRANDAVPPVGDDSGIGTNMHRLSLKLQYRKNVMSNLPNQGSEFPLVALGIGLACTVIFLTSVAVFLIIRNHNEKVIPPGYMTVSVTNNSDKNHLNVNNQYYHSYEENTEV